MEIEIVKSSSKGTQSMMTLNNVDKSTTIGQIKKMICSQKKSLYPERISLRAEAKGKSLSDSIQLSKIDNLSSGILFFKDLGPQIAWSTVFLCEYAGPLFCYLIFYFRPAIFYGPKAASANYHYAVQLAALCWSFHYIKRIMETIFVHRFSHSTMPIMNLFINCSYYWSFSLYCGYYINHPLYTPAYFKDLQIYAGLLGFLVAEYGNFSIHIALRNLRPPGTTERKIPKPTSNPFTLLFNLVSCPNYTYEIAAWLSFSLMTQALPALLFTAAGCVPMFVWGLGKHRNYKKEFPNYPRGRKALIPFIL